jgi:very-short-patch-repair endonuclease
MLHFSAELAARVAIRHGAVHQSELICDGTAPSSIRRCITAGELIVHHRQTYRVATSQDTFEFRCAAVCLAEQSAIVTGPAAARLWEFRHVKRVDHPIVLIEHGRNALSHGILVRRSNQMSRDDVVVRSDGIRLASPPRAWFDCGRDLDDEHFERLTEWVIDKHVTPPTLWNTIQRLGQQGRPGLARVRRVFSQRAMWQRPTGSGLELRVLRALEQAGVPDLVRQHPIRLPDGSLIHPDGALPELRWAVEVDHVTWHGGRFDAQYDKGRDRLLRKIGWQVERITDQEVREDLTGTIAGVVEMYLLRKSQKA